MAHTVTDILFSLATRNTGTRWGIGTALQYVKSIEACFAGAGGLCPTKSLQLASGDLWAKELAAAAERLTYCDAGQEIEKSLRDGIGITAGAVLEYDCVLSSRRKDRDLDIVESKGLEIDLKMPLLWQHIQVSPIGKHVALLGQDENSVRCKFAIADTELGRDAATLARFGALRKSHGFKPYEFEPLEIVKNAAGQDVARGWHVKRAGVMEGSLVSIPANVDGNITAVYEKEFDGLATAYSRGLLHNEVVKHYAKSIYEKRPLAVSVGIELAVKSGQQELTFNPIAGRWQDPVTKQFVAASDLNEKRITADTGAAKPAGTAKKCERCGGMCDSTGSCGDCGLVGGKAATPPDHKAIELDQKMYGMADDNLEGSYEWVSSKLQRTAISYLFAKGAVSSTDAYSNIIATFPGKAIVCVVQYGPGARKQTCYEIGWEKSSDSPQWSGDVKEVEIKPTVIEKLLANLQTKSTGAVAAMSPTTPEPARPTIKQLANQLAGQAVSSSDHSEALKACEIVAEAAFLIRKDREQLELAELLAGL